MNKLLKERWFDMSDEQTEVWKKWQIWDRLRYKRDMAIRTEVLKREEIKEDGFSKDEPTPVAIPAKRKIDEEDGASGATSSFHIPKKKRPHEWDN